MQEKTVIPQVKSKQEQYNNLFNEIKQVISEENDLTSNLENIASVLHNRMDFHWTGFYFVKNGELRLETFRGPSGHARNPKNKGICTTAYEEERLIWVDDVEQFPAHIPQSNYGKAEMVIPGFKNGEVALLLKVNASQPEGFDYTDKRYFSRIMNLVEKIL